MNSLLPYYTHTHTQTTRTTTPLMGDRLSPRATHVWVGGCGQVGWDQRRRGLMRGRNNGREPGGGLGLGGPGGEGGLERGGRGAAPPSLSISLPFSLSLYISLSHSLTLPLSLSPSHTLSLLSLSPTHLHAHVTRPRLGARWLRTPPSDSPTRRGRGEFWV